jgi:hypothetical protein
MNDHYKEERKNEHYCLFAASSTSSPLSGTRLSQWALSATQRVVAPLTDAVPRHPLPAQSIITELSGVYDKKSSGSPPLPAYGLLVCDSRSTPHAQVGVLSPAFRISRPLLPDVWTSLWQTLFLFWAVHPRCATRPHGTAFGPYLSAVLSESSTTERLRARRSLECRWSARAGTGVRVNLSNQGTCGMALLCIAPYSQ